MSNSKTHVVYELLRRGLLDKSEILDGASGCRLHGRHHRALVMRRERRVLRESHPDGRSRFRR